MVFVSSRWSETHSNLWNPILGELALCKAITQGHELRTAGYTDESAFYMMGEDIRCGRASYNTDKLASFFGFPSENDN